MKKRNEPTEQILPSQAAPSRYRFTPPVLVTVKTGDLEAAIPHDQRLKPFPPDQTVDLPAAEIFTGNVPKISLRVLSRLLPDHVAAADAVIVLPVARLAAAYAPVEHAENGPAAAPQERLASALAEPAHVEIPLPQKKRHGIFSGLPIFFRKPAPEAGASDELPAAEGTSAGLEAPQISDQSSGTASPPEALSGKAPEKAENPEEPSAQEPPSEPFLKTESPLPPTREIGDQELLQSLFLTEDTLTVDRVVALCGGLPGINSCVLTLGPVVVVSHNVPGHVDLALMSSQAVEVLEAVGKAAAHMGTGGVPAVTLHTEKGIISFLHREELTLLVFHKDRGFLPGVREKLATALGELAKSRVSPPTAG